MQVILATRNAHKLRELSHLLAWPGLTFAGAAAVPGAPDVEETGDTFEANARLKAEALARAGGGWALADDSGLEAEALAGAPGVISARFSGPGATDASNRDALLRALATRGPDATRAARFRCVLALAGPGFPTQTVEGACSGRLADAPRGDHGFGYDPLFIPDGHTRTFAEMAEHEKHALSHRGRAIAEARRHWMPWLGWLAVPRLPAPPRDAAALLALGGAYQPPALLGALAELGVFNALAHKPANAGAIAAMAACDLRALTVLLDAASAIGLILKTNDTYALPPETAGVLADGGPESVAAMLRHQFHGLARWARLPWTARDGRPADPGYGVNGADAERADFIGAMEVVSRPVARQVVAEVAPSHTRCVLDLGGASGTWTLAWLAACPDARAILLDLPDVVPLARARLEREGVLDRVALAAGDYLSDAEPLPAGADVAWLSATTHQHSRDECRTLYRRVARALPPGGRLMIRDLLMDDTRTAPARGALFAVHMLGATEGGGTWTLREYTEDLQSAGFEDVRIARRDEGMNSVLSARKAPPATN